MKKKLSVARAVEAASILYELNSRREGVLALAGQAGLIGFAGATPEDEEKLLREWRAFVHAAVLYGLMAQAPNVVVVAYLRATRVMLEKAGYAPEDTGAFVDGAFAAYVEPLLRARTGECPDVFFRRLTGHALADASPHAAAVVSGAMAMIFAAVLDKLEQYEYLLD